MRLRIRDFAPNVVLSGSLAGADVFAKLIPAIAAVKHQGPIYLDFEGIEVATGSFLREVVFGFRSYCRSSRSELYAVVANLGEDVREELEHICADKNEVVVVCRLDAAGRVTAPTVIGPLEERQRFTLDAVLRLEETDAATLAERFKKSDPIGVTGWNNRLAALSAKGILAEVRIGRTKRYRPLLEGLSYGD